jgi:murein DD-endopeptidase MepM/ murein hydrolase activator NlpD
MDDDIVYRPKYPRQLTGQSRRKPRRNKRDKGGIARKLLTKTVRQTLICLLVLAVIASIIKISTPQTNFLQNKLKGILAYNIDLKGAGGGIQKVLTNLANGDEALVKDKDDSLEKYLSNSDDLGATGEQKNTNEELEPASAVFTEVGSVVESANYNNSEDEEQTENDEETGNSSGAEDEKIFGNVGYSFIIPVGGIIGSFFSERVHPIKNEILFHKGIDIEALSGTPIKAAYEGEVIEADKEETYGNYVKIKHIDGLTTLYAHCSKLLVKKGQKVKQGDIIAEVGCTGAADGPHLHFEVRKDNVAVNPLDYIALQN